MDNLTYQWFLYLDKRIEHVHQMLHAQDEMLHDIAKATILDPAKIKQIADAVASNRTKLDSLKAPPEVEPGGGVRPPPTGG